MGDRASAERACKDPNPIIDGRKANVNLAILGAKPRGNISAGKISKLLIKSPAKFGNLIRMSRSTGPARLDSIICVYLYMLPIRCSGVCVQL